MWACGLDLLVETGQDLDSVSRYESGEVLERVGAWETALDSEIIVGGNTVVTASVDIGGRQIDGQHGVVWKSELEQMVLESISEVGVELSGWLIEEADDDRVQTTSSGAK